MNTRELCYSTLRTNSFLMVSKKLLSILGGHPVLLLSFLIEKEYYHYSKEDLTEDGFFYETIENAEKELNMSRYEQDSSIKCLVEKHLIESLLKGLPARRHFKINHPVIISILNQVCKDPANYEISTGSVKTDGSSVCKDSTNLIAENSQQIKINNKNKPTLDTSCDRTSFGSSKIKINRNKPLNIVDDDEPKFPDRKPKISTRLVSKPRVPTITSEIREIMDHWADRGFKLHREGNQSEAKVVNDIQSLLDGTFFKYYEEKGYDRTYNKREIKLSIDNMSLAAFDPDVLPLSSRSKEYLQNIRFCDFFYCPKVNKGKSLFLEWLFKKPERASNSKLLAVKDDNPHVSNILITWFKQKFNMNGNFSIKDRNNLIRCGQQLSQFWSDNGDKLIINSEWKRIYGQSDIIAFLAVQLTRAFDKELRENEGLFTMFHSGWVLTDKTFQERLPKFLKSERMMK